MTTAYNSTAPSSGCGCGGSSAQDCGCGQGYASMSQPALSDALMRPRFFPGQLLTEDDLGLLVSYMTAKNRLHNRFLFGAGVVAGLQVRKHPANPRAVRVDAGYALDTQGNDLVVPCRQELDIISLVRELVRVRMGKDCEPVNEPAPPEGDPLPQPLRQYALYLRYHEQPAEPVAPYTTGDDPCAAQACQFSRVREGFVFELRCFAPQVRHGFQEALRRCRESKGAQTAVWPKDLNLVTERARELRQALDKLPSQPVSSGEGAPAQGTYVLSQEDIDAARALLRAGPATDAPLEEKAKLLERAASLVARYDLSQKPPDTRELFEQLRKSIQGDGHTGLADEVLAGTKSTELSPLVRKTVTVIAVEAKRLTQAEHTQDWGSLRHRLLAGGAALDDELRAEYQAVADKTLGQQPVRPPAAQTQQLTGGTLSSRPKTQEEALNFTVGQLEQVSKLEEDAYRQCLCEVLNPPYTHPEDPAVLLARVDVRACEVVEICNMERQLVPSPAAVQYWLGDPLHQLLEQSCCGPRRPQYEEKHLQEAGIPRTKGMDMGTRGRELLDAMMRMTGAEARPQVSVQASAGLRQSEARALTRPAGPAAPSEPVRTSTPPRPAEPQPRQPSVEKVPTPPPGAKESTVTPGTTRTGRRGTRGGGLRG